MWAPMTRETSSESPGSTRQSSCQRPPYPRVRGCAPRRRRLGRHLGGALRQRGLGRRLGGALHQRHLGWRPCATRVSVPPPGAALSVGVAPALLLLCLGLWFVYFGVGWSPCCCDRWRSCSGIWDCSWVVYFTLYRALARCTPHSHTRNQKQGPRRKIRLTFFYGFIRVGARCFRQQAVCRFVFRHPHPNIPIVASHKNTVTMFRS
jgi:hypothetical protein